MRKRVPKALRLLRGVHLERVNHQEPEPPPVVSLDPPAWLGEGVAAAKWREMVPLLAGMRLLTAADVDAIGRYCCLHERWVHAIEQCRAGHEVTVYTGKDGRPCSSQLSPWATLVHRLATELRKLASEFGFTPSSRTSIVGQAAPDEGDPLADFLKKYDCA